MSKILITGGHGLLGQKLAVVFAQESDHSLLLTDLSRSTIFTSPVFDYQQLDITQRSDVHSLVKSYQPDVIINTAALTDVDACEVEHERAWRINVDGLKNLILAARKLERCYVLQVSTDYVFDGKHGDYAETSRTNPLSYYGKTKLAAENALKSGGVSGAIVRTQVLYGTGYDVRKNFVTWVVSMLEKGKPFNVVIDQVGNPTLADDLAYGIFRITEKRCDGVYHIAGSDVVSRYDFARAIAEEFGFDPAIIGQTTSDQIEQAAHRPQNSSFITLKFEAEFGYKLSGIHSALRTLKQQLKDGAQFLDTLIKQSS